MRFSSNFGVFSPVTGVGMTNAATLYFYVKARDGGGNYRVPSHRFPYRNKKNGKIYTNIMLKNRADFIIKLILITICAFFVFNFGKVGDFFSSVYKVFQPIIIGVALALAMAVPLRFFERKLYKKIKKPKLKEFLSVFTTLLLFGGVLTALILLVVPQGVKSVKDIMDKMSSGNVETFLQNVKGMEKLAPYLQKAYSFLRSRIAEYLPKIVSLLQDLLTGVYNVLFGIVIAVMLLLNRASVKLQVKKFIFILFKNKNPKVISFLTSASKKFSGYLGGQLTESFILGTACFITFSLLRVPYAALISLVVGFMNLIPIFGAYIAGFSCAVIVLSADPGKVLVFLIALLILQQIEGFTTYPVIVGKYVGISGFWTTVSVIVWGGVFGFWGMFFSVPLTAFLFDLFENYYKKKTSETKFLAGLPPPEQ